MPPPTSAKPSRRPMNPAVSSSLSFGRRVRVLLPRSRSVISSPMRPANSSSTWPILRRPHSRVARRLFFCGWSATATPALSPSPARSNFNSPERVPSRYALRMLRLIQIAPPLLLLVIATTLEVSGDAVLRMGLYNNYGGTLRVFLFLGAAALLFGYGLFLNLAPLEFGRGRTVHRDVVRGLASDQLLRV